MQLAVECELDAVVRQSLAVQARGDAGLLEQLDRRLLEHAGADAAHHIGGGLRCSTITASMPALCESAPSSRPAGPAPTIATWVRSRIDSSGSRRRGRRMPGLGPPRGGTQPQATGGRHFKAIDAGSAEIPPSFRHPVLSGWGISPRRGYHLPVLVPPLSLSLSRPPSRCLGIPRRTLLRPPTAGNSRITLMSQRPHCTWAQAASAHRKWKGQLLDVDLPRLRSKLERRARAACPRCRLRSQSRLPLGASERSSVFFITAIPCSIIPAM